MAAAACNAVLGLDNYRPCDGGECDASADSAFEASDAPQTCGSSSDCTSAGQFVCSNGKCVSVSSLATGSANHMCAVMSDGTLWCWGSNKYGQLGRGSTGGVYPQPKVVAQSFVPDAVTSAVVGDDYTCALTVKGDVRCWGNGVTGGGETAVSAHVNLPTNAGSLAGGAVDACAVLGDGSVFCWGANVSGEIGACAATDAGLAAFSVSTFQPKQLFAASEDVTEVAIGNYTTCGRTSVNDTVKCVGDDSWGGLGDGQVKIGNCRTASFSTFAGNRLDAIVAGDYSACARSVTGGVWYCWGMNYDQYNAGILRAVGSALDFPSPTKLSGYASGDISIGWLHSCVVDAAGVVTCWGESQHGTTGVFGAQGGSEPPHVIAGIEAVKISAQRQFTCAIATSGAVLCWGNNEFGTLAQPINNGMTTPQVVAW